MWFKKYVTSWLQQEHLAISNGIIVKAYPLKVHTAQAHEKNCINVKKKKRNAYIIFKPKFCHLSIPELNLIIKTHLLHLVCWVAH